MSTVCRLVPWKGLDTLIKSLKNIPNLGLIIIGEGPLEQDLKHIARDLQVENRVIFTGRKKKSEIPAFLEKSDFFILNSSYEGLPHVVLEAMACRKMVLASQVGGTPEVVRHEETGLLFNYNDLNSIHSAIQTALTMDKEPILNKASQFIENHFHIKECLLTPKKS